MQIAQAQKVELPTPAAAPGNGQQSTALTATHPRQEAPLQLMAAIHDSPCQLARRHIADDIQGSPVMTAQRKKLASQFGIARRSDGEVAQRTGLDVTQQVEGDTVPRIADNVTQRFDDDVTQCVTDDRAPQASVADTPTLQKTVAAGPASQLKPAAASKPNHTGLPDNLKSGIESLSGMAMDHVKVHYNSSRPAQLNALAYAQGSDIHVAPGQQKHVPHEAWHVVQQAQGRVRPTRQMKGGTPVNDDAGLEHEADVMGARALQMQAATHDGSPESAPPSSSGVAQRQALTGDDVSDFLERLKAAEDSATLNLYTHVLADGIGDAGLIGALYTKIDSEKDKYGIQSLNTYVAVELIDTADEADEYEDENEGEKPLAFSETNNYVAAKYAAIQNTVLSLAHSPANHAVWAITPSPNLPRKSAGRTASQMPAGGWQIQYPVPADDSTNAKRLNIKEMGHGVADNTAKTGEVEGGIGYGIPDIADGVADHLTENEIALLDAAAEASTVAKATMMAGAWLASIKELKTNGKNPLLPVIRAAAIHCANKMLYLPGGMGATLASGGGVAVANILTHDGLSLKSVQVDDATMYVLAGPFRNVFLRYCMKQITSGVILSGGEGLYSESLATEGDTVAPVMAGRYPYQYSEIANALAANFPLTTHAVDKYEDDSLAHSDLYAQYGFFKTGGKIYYYAPDEAEPELKTLYNPHTIKLNPGPVEKLANGTLTLEFSQQLSSLYFPLSLNSSLPVVRPANYSFDVAKTTFRIERDRLKGTKNWFDRISDVANAE